MNTRIEALLNELEPLITPENFQDYKERLKQLGLMIDAEEYFASHPVEVASGNSA